jgi:hypothetical protein
MCADDVKPGPAEKLSSALDAKEIFSSPLEPSPKSSSEAVGKPWRKRSSVLDHAPLQGREGNPLEKTFFPY